MTVTLRPLVAGRMPVPAKVGGIERNDDDVGYSGADLLIAAWADVLLVGCERLDPAEFCRSPGDGIVDEDGRPVPRSPVGLAMPSSSRRGHCA